MILIAHNIRSLHNVGSILRSADAFGIERVYLTGFTGAPPRAEISKTALGAEDRVMWRQMENVHAALEEVRADGYSILALDNCPGAEPIDVVDGRAALILGNEVEGIDESVLMCVDRVVEIPLPGRKRSLNVSVATGIALFALSRRGA
jgi:tRNA G18 (ribose-2'-O)-methylase SpoU